jgi:competence protein ComEC
MRTMIRKEEAMQVRIRLILALLFAPLVLLMGQGQSNVTGDLKVHYLNVGQADAIYITCPTGEHSMLIDAADTRYPGSSKDFKEGLEKLTGGLHKTIDVVIGSHNHTDHLGNMRWVLQNYNVKRYVDDGVKESTKMYKLLKKTLDSLTKAGGLEYEPATASVPSFSDFCPADNVDAKLIIPDAGFPDHKHPNDCSVVVKVIYGMTSFLFPGDAEKAEEGELVADPTTKQQLAATVLKAPHHGSCTSSTLDFVEAVSPTYVVVSCGQKGVGTNVTYKHPQSSSLENFNKVLTTNEYRKDKIEVYDHSTKKWTKMRAKSGIYYTKVDGEVDLISDGTNVLKK